MASNKRVKPRIIVSSIFIFLSLLFLVFRVGYLQIVNGQALKVQANRQYTSDHVVIPKRGNIYDRNKKKLATNIGLDTIEVIPQFIDKELKRDYAKKLSEILELDEESVYGIINSNKRSAVLKRWIDSDTSEILKEANLRGVLIIDDTKRYYPFGSLASLILGNTNIDNVGQYGIENTFNDELTGIPGRAIRFTYANKRDFELPYTNGKTYEAEDGLGVVLTIDEVIQNYSDKLADSALIEYQAKRVSILVMDPKTGDLLSMSSKPDYNPNDRAKILYNPETPWIPLSENELNKINSLPWSEKENYIYNNWRNFNVNGTYEPGSTFKLITTAAALEENRVNLTEKFFCDGYATQIKGANIKCWSYRNPHGEQTLAEALQNSCNEVLVELALRLGNEKLYEYTKSFGFGNKTNIDLPGEELGIVRTPNNMNDVELATISFGQGINVTPIQLITAISSFGNDGNLMKPRIVKALIDEAGNEVDNIDPEVVRKVVSNETAYDLLAMMETVVTEGTGKNAYIPGYRVGGKTGTAQKIINGKYDEEKFIASFVAIAPINNPQLAVLVIVDEPGNGENYGGKLAAPIARDIIRRSLNYLDIKPESNNN